MNNAPSARIYDGQDPEKTPSNVRALFSWADDAVAKAPQNLNDALRHAATLSVAVLAGAVTLTPHEGTPTWHGGGAILLLIVGVVASLWGLIPTAASMDMSSSKSIQTARRRGLLWKLWSMRVACACMATALALLAYGLWATGYRA